MLVRTIKQRWAPQTRYTLRRNAASIMKHLIGCSSDWEAIKKSIGICKETIHKRAAQDLNYFVDFAVTV